MSEKEIWKDVDGFEGYYQISNMGRLKRLPIPFNPWCKSEHVYSVKNKKGWYLTIILRKGELKKTSRIHRLVAEAFLPNPLILPEVNHKDCNKQNNHVSNLEWVSRSENVRHAIKMKPEILDGMISHNQNPDRPTIEQYTFNGHFVNRYSTAREAQRMTGVCGRNILQVCRKDEYKPGMIRRQAGGFYWYFEYPLDFRPCI